MENLNTVLKVVAKNGNVKFLITENESFLQTSIDHLDLDARSNNALHRGGILTVKDIINKKEDICKIRNCGAKSINRIMYKVCSCYYNQLSEDKKVEYLDKLIELNK